MTSKKSQKETTVQSVSDKEPKTTKTSPKGDPNMMPEKQHDLEDEIIEEEETSGDEDLDENDADEGDVTDDEEDGDADEDESDEDDEESEESEEVSDESLNPIQQVYRNAAMNFDSEVSAHSIGVKLLVTASLTTPDTHSGLKDVLSNVETESGNIDMYNPFTRAKNEGEATGVIRSAMKDVFNVLDSYATHETVVLSDSPEHHLAICANTASAIGEMVNHMIEEAAGLSNMDGIPVSYSQEEGEEEESEESEEDENFAVIPFDSIFGVNAWVSKPTGMETIMVHTDIVVHLHINAPYLYDTKNLMKRVDQIEKLLGLVTQKQELNIETYFGVILSASSMVKADIRNFIGEILPVESEEESESTSGYSMAAKSDIVDVCNEEDAFSGNDDLDDILPVDMDDVVNSMFPYGGDLLIIKKV